MNKTLKFIMALIVTIGVTACMGVAVYAYSGSGTLSDPYNIYTESDWGTLMSTMSDNAEEKYFNLMNDITITNTANVGYTAKYFTLYGRGYKITYDVGSTSAGKTGLFNEIGAADIYNLYVDGRIMGATDNGVGGIAGTVSSACYFYNCTSSVKVYNTKSNAGGLVGRALDGKSAYFYNCKYIGLNNGYSTGKDACVYAYWYGVGGIIGAGGYVDAYYCSTINDSATEKYTVDSAKWVVGGIVGNCEDSGNKPTIHGCVYAGTALKKSESKWGSIIGSLESSDTDDVKYNTTKVQTGYGFLGQHTNYSGDTTNENLVDSSVSVKKLTIICDGNTRYSWVAGNRSASDSNLETYVRSQEPVLPEKTSGQNVLRWSVSGNTYTGTMSLAPIVATVGTVSTGYSSLADFYRATSSGQSYRVSLLEDITVYETNKMYGNVTVHGNNHTIYMGEYGGAVFKPYENSTLALHNVVIDGKGSKKAWNAIASSNSEVTLNYTTIKNTPNYAIYVHGGTLNINDGCSIINNAGGIDLSSAEVNMNGGEISNNTGSAVNTIGTFARGDTIFNMNGGAIKGNTTSDYGTFRLKNGSFNMKGGEISGNTARHGGVIYVYQISDLDINITGGTIKGNTATAAGGLIYYASMCTTKLEGATITDNTDKNGYGIYILDKSYDDKLSLGSNLTLKDNMRILYSDLVITPSNSLYFDDIDLKVSVGYTPTEGKQFITGNYIASTVDKIYSVQDGWYINQSGCWTQTNPACYTVEGVSREYITLSAVNDYIGTGTGVINVIGDDSNLKSITVKGNITMNGNGHKLSMQSGPIAVYANSSITLNDIVLDGKNTSSKIIYSNNGTVNINTGTVIKNSRSGGIHNYYGTVNMAGGSIINNKGTHGAGILNEYGKVNITGGSITGNEVSGGGGGIYTTGGSVNIKSCDINQNKGSNNSADIYLNIGTLGLGNGVNIGEIYIQAGAIGVNEVLSSNIDVTLSLYDVDKRVLMGNYISSGIEKINLGNPQWYIKSNGLLDKYYFNTGSNYYITLNDAITNAGTEAVNVLDSVSIGDIDTTGYVPYINGNGYTLTGNITAGDISLDSVNIIGNVAVKGTLAMKGTTKVKQGVVTLNSVKPIKDLGLTGTGTIATIALGSDWRVDGSAQVYDPNGLSTGAYGRFVMENTNWSIGETGYLKYIGIVPLPGDVNGDSKVDVFDAAKVAKYGIGGEELTDEEKGAADVNGDDKVDVFDAAKIAKVAIGSEEI